MKSAISGKNMTKTNTKMIIKPKGKTLLIMFPIDSSGTNVFIANKFIPTGGVMTASSILITIMIPNQIGSYPKLIAIGKKIGVVINRIDTTSRKKPITSQIKLMIKITTHGDTDKSVMKAARSCGKPKKVNADPKTTAPTTTVSNIALVFTDSINTVGINLVLNVR